MHTLLVILFNIFAFLAVKEGLLCLSEIKNLNDLKNDFKKDLSYKLINKIEITEEYLVRSCRLLLKTNEEMIYHRVWLYRFSLICLMFWFFTKGQLINI